MLRFSKFYPIPQNSARFSNALVPHEAIEACRQKEFLKSEIQAMLVRNHDVQYHAKHQIHTKLGQPYQFVQLICKLKLHKIRKTNEHRENWVKFDSCDYTLNCKYFLSGSLTHCS